MRVMLQVVPGLSGFPKEGRFEFASTQFDKLTHYLIRYPAKFHPPVARALIEQFSAEGDHILDPFCGSGTLLVEAAVAGRRATGQDIDPLAAFASRVKTQRLGTSGFARSCKALIASLSPHRRTENEYWRRRFEDISPRTLEDTLKREKLWRPPLDNIEHWFRKYVIVDLARINKEIDNAKIPERHRAAIRLAFASIIRASSNADPVPVSGLEVTAHMKRKDEDGRVVDPFTLMDRALKQYQIAFADLAEAVSGLSRVDVRQGDATRGKAFVEVDVVITSPPYHNAVDYYRRHQLEAFWLKFASSREDRLAIKPRYIGRHRVANWEVDDTCASAASTFVAETILQMKLLSPERAKAFQHYSSAMHRWFRRMARTLPPGGRCVTVVGNSTWNGNQISTPELLSQLAVPFFDLTETMWYPIKNRHMSYARHNAANIDVEYVLVFSRSKL
jgi:hypothetical protein